MSNTSRTFDCGFTGSVTLLGSSDKYLGVKADGIIEVPNAGVPRGFHLVVGVPTKARSFVVQKNVEQELGGYHTEALGSLGTANGYDYVAMVDPVEVKRAGSNVWTSWHKERPNRLDLWTLAKDGGLSLFQIGVITHDDGATWRLHGEYRWKGKVFSSANGLVARPEEARWGAFHSWGVVFNHRYFKELLTDAKILPWTGSAADLDPALPEIPKGKHAVLQWYVPFAGQTGQGPVWLRNGQPAWVHGCDIQQSPDPDGVKRLWRGDIVTYESLAEFGKKPNGPPKLVGVRRVG